MDRGPADLAIVVVNLTAVEDAVTHPRAKLRESARDEAEVKCKTC